ncbi:hypothetical protein DFP72DRAFT_1067856 [Ephemerocybe angulata]|uniref:Uncharacterized protein n=1 Tax=Ephemerocybe angulata TaxID=980116 RepID=A0A8H6HXN6_9AGAR|nr:hypothetical protein DFP72DRAFT_1067856 [Tulosesus angulatus]
MAPNLRRLQVASFSCRWNDQRAQVAAPSYRFRSLEWLALGAVVSAASRDSPQSSQDLSKLLEDLSAGSGLPCLKRIDLLADFDIPRIFTDMHASKVEIVCVTGTKRPPVQWTPFLRRFSRLKHFVIVMVAYLFLLHTHLSIQN